NKEDTYHSDTNVSQKINKNHDSENYNKNLKHNVIDIWERCLPASSNHPYILKKQGNSSGLRYYPSNEQQLKILGQNISEYIVLPCWKDNEIQTLQFIPANGGKKLNLPGASFNDGYFVVGNIQEILYVCEGIGQAWAINKASAQAAIVCFGAGRMLKIATLLHEKYPNARLIIIPDRGKEKLACDIATAISAAWIELPKDKPANYDVNDYALEYGHEKLELLLNHLKTPEMHYRLLSGDELLNAPPMRWIVQGVLPAEGLAALYGASGSGKSFLILDMAFAIATGEKFWFGHKITKKPVTYVALEGESGLGKRIKAWSIYCNKSLPDNLRFITQPFNLLSTDITDLAKAIIGSCGANGLVVIDTLNRAAPGADENSSIDMGNIIASAKKLQNLIGGIILLVHHTGKDATKGLRGHSSLFAALDCAIEVIKTDYRREWSISKSKDDITGNSNPFKLEIVQIGIDENGNKITSCIAVFDNTKNINLCKPISLGRNQKIALEQINKHLESSLYVGKEGAPTLAKCINYSEAVSLIAERMPADAKHRKSRAIGAIGGLIEKKLIGMQGEWLWKI
ncbi:MAG: AAA family ATPase, partial [Gammaproteobacteria bacterium]|nr:AAA family ATPase [Gammaproteobacteria bacterium]